MREWYGSVCFFNVSVNMIQCVSPSGRALDMLVKFGEDRLQVCLVKVACNDVDAVGVGLLEFVYGV